MIVEKDSLYEIHVYRRKIFAIHKIRHCILYTISVLKKVHAEKANEVFASLCKDFNCAYDESASIGKRYRRQDAIGTPFCVTVDDETINNNTVTIRDRDTMEQITLPVDEVVDYISERVKF